MTILYLLSLMSLALQSPAEKKLSNSTKKRLSTLKLQPYPSDSDEYLPDVEPIFFEENAKWLPNFKTKRNIFVYVDLLDKAHITSIEMKARNHCDNFHQVYVYFSPILKSAKYSHMKSFPCKADDENTTIDNINIVARFVLFKFTKKENFLIKQPTRPNVEKIAIFTESDLRRVFVEQKEGENLKNEYEFKEPTKIKAIKFIRELNWDNTIKTIKIFYQNSYGIKTMDAQAFFHKDRKTLLLTLPTDKKIKKIKADFSLKHVEIRFYETAPVVEIKKFFHVSKETKRKIVDLQSEMKVRKIEIFKEYKNKIRVKIPSGSVYKTLNVHYNSGNEEGTVCNMHYSHTLPAFFNATKIAVTRENPANRREKLVYKVYVKGEKYCEVKKNKVRSTSMRKQYFIKGEMVSFDCTGGKRKRRMRCDKMTEPQYLDTESGKYFNVGNFCD